MPDASGRPSWLLWNAALPANEGQIVKRFAPLSDAPVARNRDQHLVAAAVEGGRGRSAGGGWVAGPTVPSTFLGLLAHPQTRVGLVPLSDAAVARH